MLTGNTIRKEREGLYPEALFAKQTTFTFMFLWTVFLFFIFLIGWMDEGILREKFWKLQATSLSHLYVSSESIYSAELFQANTYLIPCEIVRYIFILG